MSKTIFKPAGALIAAGLLSTAPLAGAEPQSGLNLRAGAYLDQGDPVLGIDYQIPVSPRLAIVPGAEYVFVDRGDLFTFNLDSRYDLNPSARNPMWVGAGVGAIHRDIGFVDDTDPAVNLLWGMDFNNADSWTPFVNSKAILTDNSEFSISFGIRFGQPGRRSTAQSTNTAGGNIASTNTQR